LKLAAVALFAAPALPAQVSPPAAQPAQRGHLRPSGIIQSLGLSNAQKQQARSIFQQARETAQPLRQQLVQNRQMLHDTIKNGNAPGIQPLAAEQGNLRGQLIAIRAEAWNRFLNLLTPDQRTQASQMMR